MRKVKGHILAVVGAQYGSEGKGVIVNYLANRYHVHVRTGGPNAGHSFIHKGRIWKMQVIPCGWTNPEAILVLGRGMLGTRRSSCRSRNHPEGRPYYVTG